MTPGIWDSDVERGASEFLHYWYDGYARVYPCRALEMPMTFGSGMGKSHWSRYEKTDGRYLPGFGKRSTFLINVFFAHMPQLAIVETLLRLSNRHCGTLYS